MYVVLYILVGKKKKRMLTDQDLNWVQFQIMFDLDMRIIFIIKEQRQ